MWGGHVITILGIYGPAPTFSLASLSVPPRTTATGSRRLQKAVEWSSPVPAAAPGTKSAPRTHHVFDLAVPVAEDDGVGGIAHRQHHCKGDAHGDRDQGVERVNVQRFGLEEESSQTLVLTLDLHFLFLIPPVCFDGSVLGNLGWTPRAGVG